MTRRPSAIRETYEISLPEPRDAYETRVADEFERAFKAIWQVLRAEVMEIRSLERNG
jgi:ABC-type nitrate/sulfonate/bicarbonate transport system ATPase subunit